MFLTSVVCHGFLFSKWRSPEEYADLPLDEKVDVFSLGNNMYSLLTGLWVFFDETNSKIVQARIQRGEKAYLDPFFNRSLADARLMEVIARCHEFDPANRPSIFDVVVFLRDAVKEVTEKETQPLSTDEVGGKHLQ
jgi:serine/threonine protein kinase